jgi:hypothetical protein
MRRQGKYGSFNGCFKQIIGRLADWSGRHLTIAGDRGKRGTPQARLRRFPSLPANLVPAVESNDQPS